MPAGLLNILYIYNIVFIMRVICLTPERLKIEPYLMEHDLFIFNKELLVHTIRQREVSPIFTGGSFGEEL